jgi:AraC-like DNA-binding protein
MSRARLQRFRPIVLGRHRHPLAYAAVVLDGSFEEAGDGGRRRVEQGDVLIHGDFEAHLDRFGRRGAVVLNLPWNGLADGPVHWRFGSVEALVRLAQRDLAAAARWLAAEARPAPTSPRADWPDLLARDLAVEFREPIGDWAIRHGLNPSTVSRSFGQVFGVPPRRFRAEARTRVAWQWVTGQRDIPLAEIAAELGFADQAHLTRAVRHLTGLPPGRWRLPMSNGFKTLSGSAA